MADYPHTKVAGSDDTSGEIRGANWPDNQDLVFGISPPTLLPLELSEADNLSSQVGRREERKSIPLTAQGSPKGAEAEKKKQRQT